MPDVKISALPAATVPLAGTEVLPIVQSSTTKKVSVADLTAGRAISASSITNSALTSGRVTYAGASGLLSDSSALTFNGSSSTPILTLTKGTSASFSGLNFVFGSATSSVTVNDSTGEMQFAAGTSSSGYFQTFLTNGTEKMRLDTSGNLLINTTTNTNSAKLKSKVSAGAVGFEVTDEASSDFVVVPAVSASVCKIGPTAGALAIQTAGTERMRLDTSGNLLVGGASTANINANGGFYVNPNSLNTFTVISHLSGASSGSPYAYFYYANTDIGSITQNGTTGVLYNLTSDYRLKNNPTALTGASEFIMALQPKTWDWHDGSGKGVGFIAHEFMEVAKYSGNGTKDEIDAEGKPKYQSIQPSSSEVMANLVALVQEQQTLIESLRQRITALENK